MACVPMKGYCQEGPVCAWYSVARKGLPVEGYCHKGSAHGGVLPGVVCLLRSVARRSEPIEDTVSRV